MNLTDLILEAACILLGDPTWVKYEVDINWWAIRLWTRRN